MNNLNNIIEVCIEYDGTVEGVMMAKDVFDTDNLKQ